MWMTQLRQPENEVETWGADGDADSDDDDFDEETGDIMPAMNARYQNVVAAPRDKAQTPK